MFLCLNILSQVQNTGECPPMKWYSHCSIPVTHECAVDVDCDNGEESEHKCCYNGCYMTCQATVQPKPGKPRPKNKSNAFEFFLTVFVTKQWLTMIFINIRSSFIL